MIKFEKKVYVIYDKNLVVISERIMLLIYARRDFLVTERRVKTSRQIVDSILSYPLSSKHTDLISHFANCMGTEFRWIQLWPVNLNRTGSFAQSRLHLQVNLNFR